MSKEKIIQLLNNALELEHGAYIQYLSHAELIDGINAEPLISRIKEIAEDEKKHQEKLRTLIGILGGTPNMKIAQTHPAESIKDILEQNLKNEKEAIDIYKKILEKLKEDGSKGYYDYILEHEIRHIIMDEQEHVTELELLLGIQGSSY